MYLWNDAFKYDHEKIFKSEYKTLDELLFGFKEKEFNIFADGVKFKNIIDATNVVVTANSKDSYENKEIK